MKSFISMLIAAFLIYFGGAAVYKSWNWSQWEGHGRDLLCVAYTIMIIMWLTDISKPKSKSR